MGRARGGGAAHEPRRRRAARGAWLLALPLTVAGVVVPAAAGRAGGDDPPEAFKRYLPRGRIPADLDPQYVPAAKAEVPPEAWVLGVVVGGQARAYELNLLTRREVVNDRVGDQPIAAVWCPLANSAVVYDRRVDGRELHFEPSGVLMDGSIVMQDKETDSYWPLLQEKSLYGPLKGQSLTRVPGAVKVRYSDWVKEHPDTLVWSLYGQQHLEPNPMAHYLASDSGYRGLEAEDTRLPTKEPVFGFARAERRYAVTAKAVEGGRVFSLGSEAVFLYRPEDASLNDSTRAFVSRQGFERRGSAWVEKDSGARFDPAEGRFPGPGAPEPLEGFDTFWYVWSLNWPGTQLLSR
jgi:hypothetical protein